MIRRLKGLTLWVLALLLSGSALAESLRIDNKELATLTSYMSAELDRAVPYWIVDGKHVTRQEARELILKQNKVSCMGWLFNFSNDKTISKSTIQNQLFGELNLIPLWKRINGKAIFIDEATNYGISYNCVHKNLTGQLEELESLSDDEFNQTFQGVLHIIGD